MVKMSGKVFAYEVVIYIYYTILHNHISSADEVWKKKFKLPKLKLLNARLLKQLYECVSQTSLYWGNIHLNFCPSFEKPFTFLFLMNWPTENVMFILQKLSRHEEILKNFIRNGWEIYIPSKQLGMVFFCKTSHRLELSVRISIIYKIQNMLCFNGLIIRRKSYTSK